MGARATLLDRAIGYLSPQWLLQRERHRAAVQALAQYYEGGGYSRRTEGWSRPGSDPNGPGTVSLANLRNQARHLVRNNGYAENALQVIQDDVVGWGILPTAQHDGFDAWSNSTDCDASGQSDLPGITQQVMRTVVEAGECLVRRRWRRMSDGLSLPLQLELLEPDFIDTSQHRRLTTADGRPAGRIVRGIEFDLLGRRTAYWLYREHPGAENSTNTSALFRRSVRVPASEILHVYKAGRPGQVRGVSWYASVLLTFKDFDEFTDATLVKQKIAACLTAIVTDPDGANTPIGETSTDQGKESWDMLEPGLIMSAPPGRDVNVINPPSVKEFPEYKAATQQQIAAGLGVTPEDLTGDYSDMNYSSARMSRLRHWKRVEGWRWRMLIPQFLTPTWRWAMEAAQLAGQAVEVNRSWTAPPLPMIEPDKEGLAIVRNIRGGISTPSEELRARGYNPTQFWDEYQRDMEDQDRRGLVTDADARKVTQQGQSQSLGQPGGGETSDDEPSDDDEPPRALVRVTAPLELEAAETSAPTLEARPVDEGGEDYQGYLSIAEASARFGISESSVRGWVRKGAIPHIRVGPGKLIRVHPRDLVNS